ncbi:MAG: ABC transporter ATP-binding protein [Planctomycetota bacterium]|jgi:lipoprotein-releasing system ATP-binding protein
MLKAEAVDKHYPSPGGTLPVLTNLSLQVESGESLAIMGPSGSGKSTLLNVLGALEPPSDGIVNIGEINPYLLPEGELAAFRNRHIGFVFQEHHLLPQCNVIENILLPSLAFDRGDKTSRAMALMEEVGLAERKLHRPAALSGGERQRAALARALINSPAVVLADEPTGNLDKVNADRIVQLLKAIHLETQCALIVVTHSEEVAANFQRIATLRDGSLAVDGQKP